MVQASTSNTSGGTASSPPEHGGSISVDVLAEKLHAAYLKAAGKLNYGAHLPETWEAVAKAALDVLDAAIDAARNASLGTTGATPVTEDQSPQGEQVAIGAKKGGEALETLYYIQNRGFCGNCWSWWRDGGHGYTCNLDEAWKVPLAEAKRICKDRPVEDKPWPVVLVDRFAERHLGVGPETLREAMAEAGVV